MAKVNFRTEELKEYGLPWEGYDGVEVISDRIVDQSRWSVYHDIIFKWIDGKYYSTGYSVGATECQDERPWEYEDEVECIEVHQVEKMVKVWEAV
ncbi:hypothetical protein [Brevibacillus laterosporus]|uniref:hypothetical protein n=1 Tax=Brevibacillus laterosporus TaxID=1465 RepID=UPI00264A6676|nr:hypothetical protein [Brevibacillus laterosporus]MDN9010043.1 hypothetical protein [Brevibacillus laterosporus]MDO0940575.1 hypothetical protein [Brevibacillus laterosporus]